MSMASVPNFEKKLRGATAAMRTTSDCVFHVASCRLFVGARTWDWASENRDAIDAHWQRRHCENPAIFNGIIHLMVRSSVRDGVFEAEFLRSDFKSYLYWREMGFPDAGVRDGFGSALIRSREGHVLLGRQSAGNINAGIAYLPGGFIDARDVDAAGSIAIAASVMRELLEETGLGAECVDLRPGVHITHYGALTSLALEVLSPLDAISLRSSLLDFIAGDAKSELDDIVIVRCIADLEGSAAPVHAYARQLLTTVLPA